MTFGPETTFALQNKTLSISNGLHRFAAAAVCLVVVIAALLVSKWAFGHAAGVNAATLDVADLAVSLAPSDPIAHSAYALLLEKTFLPADQAKSLQEFERAAELSPSNYLYWLAVGRAREQSGDPSGAEAALRKALDLAPNYSRVQWAFGNLLVRQGRYDDGFAFVRSAVAADAAFANPAAASAWQIFDRDTVKIKNFLGDSPRTNAALSLLLAADKKYSDAFDLWRGIPNADKMSFKEPGQALFAKFLEAGLYRSAIETGNSVGLFSENAPVVGSVANGGFESAIAPNNPDPFSWVIADGGYPRIGLNDAQKKGGGYSLLMNFGTGGKGFRPVVQKIGVEPGASYDLVFHYRSELKTDAKIVWQLLSAGNAKLIVSVPVSSSPDWSEARATFAVPAGTEGIDLKLAVENCSAAGCNIAGNIWFDDFSLTRISVR